MSFEEYQKLAERTINKNNDSTMNHLHALHGLCAEVGELHSLYQKTHQGHKLDPVHAKKELGDLLWFVAEYCTVNGWNMSEIAELNIQKLSERYPDGFSVEKSLNRAEGDI